MTVTDLSWLLTLTTASSMRHFTPGPMVMVPGRPILPGLVRYNEVANGEINHAVRFTAAHTRRAYVWPARHYASSLTDMRYPPMGQRFRLKAGFDTSGFPQAMQVILRAMKKYGIILADNGSIWFISGTANNNWDNDMLVAGFRRLKGSDFEAVDTSSLRVAPDSGEAMVTTVPSGGTHDGSQRQPYHPYQHLLLTAR
jgi:hypothetical protein